MKTLAIFTVLLSAMMQIPAAGNPGEMICRMTGETGSRLQRNRTCRTRAEWDQLRREQRNSIDRAQTRQVNRTIDEKGQIR